MFFCCHFKTATYIQDFSISSRSVVLSSSFVSNEQVAVDALFAHRLQAILQICVPSLMSKEALLVIAQSCLLVSRTLLTGTYMKFLLNI